MVNWSYTSFYHLCGVFCAADLTAFFHTESKAHYHFHDSWHNLKIPWLFKALKYICTVPWLSHFSVTQTLCTTAAWRQSHTLLPWLQSHSWYYLVAWKKKSHTFHSNCKCSVTHINVQWNDFLQMGTPSPWKKKAHKKQCCWNIRKRKKMKPHYPLWSLSLKALRWSTKHTQNKPYHGFDPHRSTETELSWPLSPSAPHSLTPNLTFTEKNHPASHNETYIHKY